jgi:predicted dehydrogenase
MMPRRVTAVAFIGKTHPIEVEDEVSATLEYESGLTAHFITTTGEAPGTDRLEIAGDRGKLVAEGGKLTFRMNRRPTREFRENSPLSFAVPESWEIDVPLARPDPEPARLVTQNFVNAVLKDEPLIAPGVEGVKGLEIGNAMLLSGLRRKPVELPIDGEEMDAFIKELTAKYGGRKTLGPREPSAAGEMSSSFGRRT